MGFLYEFLCKLSDTSGGKHIGGYGISRAGSIAVALCSGHESRLEPISLLDIDGNSESTFADAACSCVFKFGIACADPTVLDALIALLGICNAAADRASSPLAVPPP